MCLDFGGVDLYSSTGTVSRSLVVSTSNFENNPRVTATITNAGGATGLNMAVNGTQITISGIDTTAIRTITVQVTAFDDMTQVTQVNRTIDISDERRLTIAGLPTEIDVAANVDITYTTNVTRSGQPDLSTATGELNGVTLTPGNITGAQQQAAFLVNSTGNLEATVDTLRPPTVPLRAEATTRLYRAFFFWRTTDDFNAGPTPVTPPSTRFDGQVGNEEMRVGSVLRNSGNTQSNFYLAYPAGLGLFSYMSSFGDSDGTIVSTTRLCREYLHDLLWLIL